MMSRKDWHMDDYYKREHLANFAHIAEGNSELAKKFFDYYGSVFAEGALTVREKALIALAVSHAVQCPYCIDAYSSECVQQGADLEEMTEAVHVATAIRGGASLVHGLQMLEQVTKTSMGAQEGGEGATSD
jgi:4-carboxymuconolactone decarboxylase